MIHESDEKKLSSLRVFWKSEMGNKRFSQMVTDYSRRVYEIDDEGINHLHMALIGTESRPDEETNESVRLAAKAIATRLKMNEKVQDYFRKQGSGPLPARHHVLHSTMERAGLNSDLDLAGSASVGGALATHSYSDFLKNQMAFRTRPS